MPRFFELRSTPMDVVLRAAAIFAVVYHHSTLMERNGGAAFLLMLAGLNFARFAVKDADAPGMRRSIVDIAWQIFVPSFAMVLLTIAIYRDVEVSALLFMGNWRGFPKHVLFNAWWVQMLLQLLAGLYLLSWIPAIARATVRRPDLAMLVLFGVALLLRASGALLSIPFLTRPRLPQTQLWTFALGCVIYFFAVDTTTSRPGSKWIAATCVLAGTFVGLDFGTWRYWWLTIGGLLLVCVRHIPLPRLVARATAVVSSATFCIFLTHLVWFLAARAAVRAWAGPDAIVHPFILLFAGVVMGTLTWGASAAFGRAYRALRSDQAYAAVGRSLTNPI